jgi:hypothetical protein
VGREPLTHCHQWIVLRTKSVQCNMKIQRRNIKYWIDLRAASVLDTATEYVDQKQLKSRWTWKALTAKAVSHEGGPGVLCLKWYPLRKQTRVLTWLHLPAPNWPAASYELWVRGGIYVMWTDMSDNHFFDDKDGLVSSDIVMLTVDYLTWLVVREFSLVFSYHCRFRLCLCKHLCQEWQTGWNKN